MNSTFKTTALLAGLTLATLSTALSSAKATELPENIKLKGDFRYRHESINQDGKLDRNRQRMRARIGIDVKLDNGVKLGFRLASGSDDPVSTNQTFDDGFSTKRLGLDLAFFEWKPETVKNLKLSGGKIKNPFFKPGKAELIWDGDLNPEGMAASFRTTGGNTQFFATVGGFWVNESSSGADAGLRAAQAGLKFDAPGGKTTVTVGGGFFDYSNLKGAGTVFKSGEGFGNSLDSQGHYMYDYNLLQAFAEVDMKVRETPLSLFGDFVTNSDPEFANTGWLVGAKIGKAKKTGSWQCRYNYRKIEKDAVLGVFTDSDFRGGGTNGTGHEFGVDAMLASKVKLGASLFLNKQGVYVQNDYKRFQLDAIFKF